VIDVSALAASRLHRSRPMPNQTYVPIELFADEARLISVVLTEATENSQVVPNPSEDVRQSGATLGALAAKFEQVLGPEIDPLSFATVINLEGERLYGLRLTLEEWGLISAHLSYYGTQRLWAADESLAGREATRQAEEAFLLMHKIDGATRDR
jgi:hypothetical protein